MLEALKKSIAPFLRLALLVTATALTGACATTQDTPSRLTTVTIEKPVHFSAPDGADVLAAPGRYQVDSIEGATLRLMPVDAASSPLIVAAMATTHGEALAAPVALAVPDEAEQTLLHLVLLLPEGKGLDAAGSLTAVRPRGGSFAPVPPTQIQAAMVQQQRIVPGLLGPELGSAQIFIGPPTFSVVSYGGKCLDFGAPPQVSGAPVFIYGCNGTIAQQIEVREVNNRHEVILRAGTKVIGVKGSAVLARDTAPIVKGGDVRGPMYTTFDGPLQLQDEPGPMGPAPGQIFALDGDSIILAADRTRVVKVQGNRGANRTPLILGSRELADAEFWTFVATDKSNRKPTSGFVRVPQEKDFVRAVSEAPPGTVIEVDPSASIDLPNVYLLIPEGVTIRSNRRGTNFGGELRTAKLSANGTLLEIAGNDVRITGLRVKGPSRSTEISQVSFRGILIRDNLYLRTIIDHNDISDWTGQAVDVWGADQPDVCGDFRDPRGSRPNNARVARNFIHHNQRQEGGYGVQAHRNGFPLIEGNTFVSNRHAIMADGSGCTSYLAWNNLVLWDVPTQEKFVIARWKPHDFDVHGTGDNGFGGRAGQYFEIARNTFLGTQYKHENFDLRGEPSYRVEFHHNVSLRSPEDAVVCSDCGAKNKLLIYDNNQFNALNPTTRLGVGDFDGDGRDDLFLATGTAWYYSPAGNAEWRFLSAQPDGIGSLLFGDFDADGRTDVFTQRGRDWLVSWAGASPWEKINESDPALSEFRIGDFIGDQRADVFYADGQRWWVADGGVGAFTHTQDSGYRAADLGFGDFNGDRKMDVVGVVSGKWMVSLSATGSWAGFPLREALTKTMAGLIIADFNGNGRADIATAYGKSVSYDGRGNWTDLPARPGTFAAIGRFDANPGSDILFYWTNDNHLGIQSSGVGAPQRYSTQHMR